MSSPGRGDPSGHSYWMACALSLSLSFSAEAQALRWEEHKILPVKPTHRAEFGCDVEVRGNVAVIGQPIEPGQGRVYVFQYDAARDHWKKQQRLDPSLLGPSDFGIEIGLQPPWIAVAHRGSKGTRRNLFMFRYDGSQWAETQVLQASVWEPGDDFGRYLMLQDGLLVAGARSQNNNVGAAFVFERQDNVWSETQRLEPGDQQPWAGFGQSMARDGDVLAIGAPSFSADQTTPGAVYVFRRTGSVFLEEQKLASSTGHARDRFGMAVAVQKNRILVGAPWTDEGKHIYNSGTITVFTHDGDRWNEGQQIWGPTRSWLGGSLHLRDRVLVAGAQYAEDPSDQRGNGGYFVFEDRGGRWSLRERIHTGDGPRGGPIGRCSSFDGVRLMAGSSWDDTPLINSGSVYVFDLTTIGLSSARRYVEPGGVTRITASHGRPDGPVHLAVVEVDGARTFQVVSSGTFDRRGTWEAKYTAPHSVAARRVTLKAFGATASGALRASNPAKVFLLN